MVRIEGVFDADRNVHVLHFFRGLGVDGLHVEIGELVGYIEIGMPDDLHLVFADDLRVGRAEMVFLMDDAFAGARDDGDLRECDFGIAAVETRHDAFVVFDIACDDRHGGGDVDPFEAAADRLVEGRLLFFHPSGQIDENGVDAVFFQNQDGVVGGMGLTDGGEHFAGREEISVHVELAVCAELLEVEEAVADAVEAFVDEFVRHVQIESEIGERAVEAEHFGADGFECVLPSVVVPREFAVDARGAVFLVFEQEVGDAAIRGDDEDSVVKFGWLAVADDDVLEDFPESGHGGAADFFYCMSHGCPVPALFRNGRGRIPFGMLSRRRAVCK